MSRSRTWNGKLTRASLQDILGITRVLKIREVRYLVSQVMPRTCWRFLSVIRSRIRGCETRTAGSLSRRRRWSRLHQFYARRASDILEVDVRREQEFCTRLDSIPLQSSSTRLLSECWSTSCKVYVWHVPISNRTSNSGVRAAWSVHTAEGLALGELNIRKLQEPLMMAAIQWPHRYRSSQLWAMGSNVGFHARSIKPSI